MPTRTDHNQLFDGDGNLIEEEIVEVDITEEVNESTLDQRLADALAWLDSTAQGVANINSRMQTVIDGTATNLAGANQALDAIAADVQRIATGVGKMARYQAAIIRKVARLLDAIDDTDPDAV